MGGPTLRDVFEQTVAKFPLKEGLVDRRLGKSWTYRDWDLEVNKLANAFRHAGVEKGDRVSTILYNTAEFATTLFACMKIGAIFNPINFRLTGKELKFILSDAAPKIVLYEKATSSTVTYAAQLISDIQFWCIDEPGSFAKEYDEKISNASTERPTCELNENDPYAIMYTSGTTGMPKGVIHSHRNMVDQSLIMSAVMRVTKNERGLSVAPMFHCAELHCAFLPRLMMGGSNIIMHHFDAKELIQIIKEERITHFFGAPTMWNMILREDLTEADFSSLRAGLYGGAPMAPALVKKVNNTLEIDLFQAYGMTEMGPAISVLYDDEQLSKSGAAGKPLINHEIRVVKVKEGVPSDPLDICSPGELGEIIVKGPSTMLGYFNCPDATKEAMYEGWYHSGDIGYMDEEGVLWVSDRVKDMIISGGENIYSREVEDVLFEHSGVLDAAVVGEPDEMWGERVVAFVVKKDPSITAQELDNFCTENNRLARYKRPRRYEFMEELPRNASGKLQKFMLREQAAIAKK
ncbi:fatty acid--CoA ligase [Bacillus norwichensis]|uniref:Fatty acid--CoA ligase n=1 Tax=Bacillus norwichensis TaxID=2762217 RepID=A0ABR8VLG6_9BACI|nr:fatty acid--CoA ligase [Bacillus norwichensis]MBD8005596.1 fatty acid--CoA ligase [Bacillus norwichensis]